MAEGKCIEVELSLLKQSARYTKESRRAVTGCFNAPVKDICNGAIPDIPDMSSRETSIMIKNETSHWRYCDVYAIKKLHWYQAFSNMTTSCPSIFMCGTKFPIWMNVSCSSAKRTIPEPHEGIVSRTSCLKSFDSCCLLAYRLTVVNCEEYMAYCLIDLPSGCHQRYCFDKDTKRSTSDAMVSLAPSATSWAKQPDFVAEETPTASKREQDIISGPDNETFVHGNSNETHTFASTVPSKVLAVCTGLMATIIIALMILIVRRIRLLKVSDANAVKTKHKLESFSQPDILTMTATVGKEEKLQY